MLGHCSAVLRNEFFIYRSCVRTLNDCRGQIVRQTTIILYGLVYDANAASLSFFTTDYSFAAHTNHTAGIYDWLCNYWNRTTI